jgi:hypothetical protein
LDGGDAAIPDRHVHHAVVPGGGANDLSTAQQQIMGFVFGHGMAPSSAIGWM